MNSEKIILEEEIRDLIFDKLNIDYIEKEDVDFEVPIFSAFDGDDIGLGLDSVDVLELVVILRSNYGLEINDVGMGVLKSIKSIADCVRSIKSK